jgi:Glycosyl transferase family 2
MENGISPPEPAPSLSRPVVRVSALLSGAQAVVVLPTLNEEHGLERTLSQIPFERFGDPNYRVQPIVIDGGSTDGTVAVAQRWGVPVFRQSGHGKGAAVLEVLRWARACGVAHAVLLDADATYPPQAIFPALNLLREGSGLVLGVRRPLGGRPRRLVDLVHRMGNVALSYLASLITGRPVFDICSGFWGVSTEMFERLGVGAAEFAIEAELVLKALRAGVEVTQIPIEYRKRIGEAKLHTFRDGGAIFLSILQFGGPARPSRGASSIPGLPARELLSIGLVTETLSAILECSPSEIQMANRIGLLLNRGLPEATIRVRPNYSVLPELASPPSDGASLFVSFPGQGIEQGSGLVTVSIRPREKTLMIHLSSPDPALPAGERAATVRTGSIPLRRRLSGSKTVAALGAVTSRMNFDPGRQQASMLRANGFSVLSPGDQGFPAPRGPP